MQKSRTSKSPNAVYSIRCLPLILLTLFLSGCAGLPYESIVEGDLRADLATGYTRFSEDREECSSSFDGEIVLAWEHSLNNITVSGFFQTMLPTTLRVSILNPFGQLQYAAASDGKQFQSVDTTRRIHTTGSLRSFALLHDIPETLLSGAWGCWLSGRPLPATPYIIEIYHDREDRGTWFAVSGTEHSDIPREYILLDSTNMEILERIILDDKGNKVASILYGDWQQTAGCRQPHDISVTGLPLGAEIQLQLSDIKKASLTVNDFNIPVPPTYLRQRLP